MSITSFVQSLVKRVFSKPHPDQMLFDLIAEEQITRIVELGIGSGERSLKLIEAACKKRKPNEVHYTGIDLFEANSGDEKLSLIGAYQLLRPTGVSVRLVPGTVENALKSVANTLSSTELMVVSNRHSEATLDQVWMYIPRMLSPNSQVFWEQRDSENTPVYHKLPLLEIEQKANSCWKQQSRKAA